MLYQELTKKFALHEYDTVNNMPKSKINPRGSMISDSTETQQLKLIFAAARGDVYLIRYYRNLRRWKTLSHDMPHEGNVGSKKILTNGIMGM